jgi:hypothetical protein
MTKAKDGATTRAVYGFMVVLARTSPVTLNPKTATKVEAAGIWDFQRIRYPLFAINNC